MVDPGPRLAEGAEHEMAWLLTAARNAGFELVEVLVFDRNGHSHVAASTSGEETASASPAIVQLVEHAVGAQRTLLFSSTGSDASRAAPMWEAGHHSLAVVPLWRDHRIAGAVLAAGAAAEVPPDLVGAVEILTLRISGLIRIDVDDELELGEVHEAARLDQLKRDFVHAASHELRTPLTVIRTAAQTLERRGDTLMPETRDDLMRLLVENTRALERIFDRLLEADRAQTGLFAVRRERIDTLALCRAVVGRLTPLLSGHDVAVVGDAPVWASGDPVLIDRAVENLVANAGRHTPPGTSVRITAEVEGNDVVVAVDDDGPGIPFDELPNLGVAFFRGAQATTRAPRGLGLGLTVVGRILNAHGSRLEIGGGDDDGARFSFRLPAAEAPGT